MPTDAERKRRPVELRLTFIQASDLTSLLDVWITQAHPSKMRASIGLVRDHLVAAHKEAARG